MDGNSRSLLRRVEHQWATRRKQIDGIWNLSSEKPTLWFHTSHFGCRKLVLCPWAALQLERVLALDIDADDNFLCWADNRPQASLSHDLYEKSVVIMWAHFCVLSIIYIYVIIIIMSRKCFPCFIKLHEFSFLALQSINPCIFTRATHTFWRYQISAVLCV